MLLVFEFLKSSPAFQLVWSCCVLLCLSTLSCFILLFFFCALSCHLLPLLSLSVHIYVVRVSPYPLLCCFLMLCVFPVLYGFWCFRLPLFSVAFWTSFLPDGIEADFFELLLFLQVDILSATQPFLDKKSRKCEQWAIYKAGCIKEGVNGGIRLHWTQLYTADVPGLLAELDFLALRCHKPLVLHQTLKKMYKKCPSCSKA